MNKEHFAGAAEGHLQAEKKLDRAEEAVRKALDDLKDVSRTLKERVDSEEKNGKFPVDDDPPGDLPGA